VNAAIENRVRKVIDVSSDKAVEPINLYGMTKAVGEKIIVQANDLTDYTKFVCIRGGNVMGSSGSVIPFFREIAAQGKPLPITDLRMTRFWISIESAVKFVIDSLEMMTGGELYVPRIPSMKIVDLANAVAPGAKLEEIGMRPGEKLHEEMISSYDSRRTIVLENRYVVTPVVADWGYSPPEGSRMPEGKAFRSDTNDLWMSESDMKNFIRKL
jgi:UDP-N-acetylglucosamine 4,6-dehydratase